MAERTGEELRHLIEQAREDRGVVDTSLRGIPVHPIQARTPMINFIVQQNRRYDVMTGYIFGLIVASGEMDAEPLRRMIYGGAREDFDSLVEDKSVEVDRG